MLLKTLFRLAGLFSIILLLCANNAYSQKGALYITNFPKSDQFDFQIWDMNKADNGEMLFAHKKGVVSFDGAEWRMHKLKSIPLVLAKSHQRGIWVSTPGGFGKIAIDSAGSYFYKSLYKKGNNEIFGEIVQLSGQVAFMGDSSIYLLNEKGQITKVKTGNLVFPISGSFNFNDKLYVIASNKQYELENDSLIYKKGILFPLNNDYTFQLDSRNGFAYLANTDSKLFRYDGKKITRVKIKDQRYLDQTLLQGGVFVNDSLLALSTLNGGVLIVNIETGKTAYSINYSTGLPDDRIHDIFSLGDNSLWIAHAKGISRIDLNLQIKMYSHFNGLYGNLLTFTTLKNEIYIGTSEGLFYLYKNKDFATKRVKVKVKPKPESTAIVVKEPAIEQESNEEPKKKKRRLRKFFKRFAEKVSKTDDPEPEQKEVKTQEKEEAKYKMKTIYKLLSSNYQFEKVEKLKGKCLHLLEFKGLIMAGSNTGLYEIRNHKATWLIPNAYINQIVVSKYHKNTLLIAANKGLYIARYNAGKWDIKQHYLITDEINSISEIDSQTIVLGDFGRIRILQNPFKKAEVKHYEHPGFLMESIYVRNLQNQLLLFSSSHVYLFKDNVISRYDNLLNINELDYQVMIHQNEVTWLKQLGWKLYKNGQDYEVRGAEYLSLFSKLDNIFLDEKDNIWVITEGNDLYKIENQKQDLYMPDLAISILSVSSKDGSFLSENEIALKYSNNALRVSVSSPFYLKNNAVVYQYKLDGLMAEWSGWSQNQIIDFPFLPPGSYNLKIRSKSVLGNPSESIVLPVEIKKPFVQTTLFYVLTFIAIVLIGYIVIRLRTAKLKRDKQVLEQKVRERTKTISEQKEEIEVQRDNLAEQNEEILQQKEEITAQRDEIEVQKNQIEEQHSDIKKSITYAQRIQRAILQKESTIEHWLKEYFIFWKPRDIVSGDFYWINKVENKVIVVAADCTGHGVPGAFMSMLGVSFLNEITAKKENIESHIILNKLREYVKSTLSQDGEEGEAKDGMDMSLMIFDFDANVAEFSGAFNGLYMIRDNELSEIKADKMPVSIYMKEADSFTKHEIKLRKGDMFYMLSDGFPDQFGGDRGRKFMRKPLKQMLLDMHQKSMADQKDTLENTLREWMGGQYHQTDDIIVIGVRV
jgi:serine phosphatase RsbU (regulator of sigma subunit)/ligand-binding sensor domain-containing protein